MNQIPQLDQAAQLWHIDDDGTETIVIKFEAGANGKATFESKIFEKVMNDLGIDIAGDAKGLSGTRKAKRSFHLSRRPLL